MKNELLITTHLFDGPVIAKTCRGTVSEESAIAKVVLGDKFGGYVAISPDFERTARIGGDVLVVPEFPDGITVFPPKGYFTWTGVTQHITFWISASKALDKSQVEGVIRIFADGMFKADISVTIHIDSNSQFRKFAEKTTGVNQKVFISYSHSDAEFISNLLRVQISEDEFFRDTQFLRAGEIWRDAIKERIAQSSTFQLCWSSNSMRSEFVQNEWEYALSLDRSPDFIKPLHWEVPLPRDSDRGLPPAEIEQLHFQYIPPFELTGLESKSVNQHQTLKGVILAPLLIPFASGFAKAAMIAVILAANLLTVGTGFIVWYVKRPSYSVKHQKPVERLESERVIVPTNTAKPLATPTLARTPSPESDSSRVPSPRTPPLALEDFETIHGSVVDEQGLPIAGVTITSGLNKTLLATSDSKGHFRFNTNWELSFESMLELEVTVTDYKSKRIIAQSSVAVQEFGELKLKMNSGGMIEGQFFWPPGFSVNRDGDFYCSENVARTADCVSIIRLQNIGGIAKGLEIFVQVPPVMTVEDVSIVLGGGPNEKEEEIPVEFARVNTKSNIRTYVISVGTVSSSQKSEYNVRRLRIFARMARWDNRIRKYRATVFRWTYYDEWGVFHQNPRG